MQSGIRDINSITREIPGATGSLATAQCDRHANTRIIVAFYQLHAGRSCERSLYFLVRPAGDQTPAHKRRPLGRRVRRRPCIDSLRKLINSSRRVKRTPAGMQAQLPGRVPDKSAQRVERPEGGPQGEHSESPRYLLSIVTGFRHAPE